MQGKNVVCNVSNTVCRNLCGKLRTYERNNEFVHFSNCNLFDLLAEDMSYGNVILLAGLRKRCVNVRYDLFSVLWVSVERKSA